MPGNQNQYQNQGESDLDQETSKNDQAGQIKEPMTDTGSQGGQQTGGGQSQQ